MKRSLLLFFAVFSLYVSTLAPTYLWSDASKLAIFVFEKQFFTRSFGSHSGHTMLGYLFSLLPLDFAYSQNLMSAFFGAGAVVMFYRLLLSFKFEEDIAMICSGGLAVSHLFWNYSVQNETYSILLFFLISVLYLATKASEKPEWLYLIAFVIGFGFTNHAAIVLAVPGVIPLLWNRRILSFVLSFRILIVVACFLAGAIHIFVIPLISGENTFNTLLSHSGKYIEMYWRPEKLLKEATRYPFYLIYQFPGAFVFGIPGLVWGIRSNARLVLSTFVVWLTFVLFAFHYFFQREFPMLLPSFVMFSVWIAWGSLHGLNILSRKYKRGMLLAVLFVVHCLMPPLVYYVTYKISKQHGLKLISVRELPYRNNARYFLFPPKHQERGAENYVNDSFRQAAHGAVIVADFNPAMAFLYAQKVLNQRRDISVKITDPWIHRDEDPAAEIIRFIRKNLREGRSVYLADRWEPYYRFSRIQQEFQITQEGGPLWLVQQKPANSNSE